MPVIGPSVNEEQVNKAYEEIMELLKTKYHIQNSDWSGFSQDKSKEMRAERNAAMRAAIDGLFELDSWEGW